ncbi:hypothetical protein HMPREF0762_01103 [Slackia exigua ATCC 700122]|uniref:Uncharacterized protein n=1 Tax=Slackia exigua (strain ATCC 700122 / DSM 15923 / CIP 105133 / JCM 11022 / KCTC 5966 / S-7) TaxID=649764 RepID=D0WH71_SLAES|nr:hypothetical protein HMPREF0762_01103 [Slackia exigua ATCC 700122]
MRNGLRLKPQPVSCCKHPKDDDISLRRHQPPTMPVEGSRAKRRAL